VQSLSTSKTASFGKNDQIIWTIPVYGVSRYLPTSADFELGQLVAYELLMLNMDMIQANITHWPTNDDKKSVSSPLYTLGRPKKLMRELPLEPR
jgi:hypothetical protein